MKEHIKNISVDKSENIEITQEMIEAGVDGYAIGDTDYDTEEEIVTDIYRRMEAVRRFSDPRRAQDP